MGSTSLSAVRSVMTVNNRAMRKAPKNTEDHNWLENIWEVVLWLHDELNMVRELEVLPFVRRGRVTGNEHRRGTDLCAVPSSWLIIFVIYNFKQGHTCPRKGASSRQLWQACLRDIYLLTRQRRPTTSQSHWEMRY